MRPFGGLERGAFVLCAGLAMATLTDAARAQVDTLAEVQEAAAVGDYARGLSLARADADPLTALRAEIWLLYRARDFEGAYDAAERALKLEPTDVWLAERACAAALWLREPVRAEVCLARFAANTEISDPALRESFSVPLRQARSAAADLAQNIERARSALRRGRMFSLSLLGAVLAVLALLGLRLRRSDA